MSFQKVGGSKPDASPKPPVSSTNLNRVSSSSSGNSLATGGSLANFAKVSSFNTGSAVDRKLGDKTRVNTNTAHLYNDDNAGQSRESSDDDIAGSLATMNKLPEKAPPSIPQYGGSFRKVGGSDGGSGGSGGGRRRTTTTKLKPSRNGADLSKSEDKGESVMNMGDVNNNRRSKRSTAYASSVCNKITFREPFTSKDFLERLMQVEVVKARASTGALDPDPFLDIIEDTTETLLKLSKEVERKIEDIEREIKSSEEPHEEELTRISQNLEISINHFENLESRIKNVALKAVHIGNQLEGMNAKKERSEQAVDLMKYFKEFDDDMLDSMSDIFTNEEKIHEAADILQKLMTMIQALPGHDSQKQRIIKKSENFETKLLRIFSSSYTEKDLDSMKKCAQTLYSFKGGHNQCVKDYINQHPFFFDAQMLNLSREENKASVFMKVAVICEDEVEQIKYVFQQPEAVMARFLERIFEQKLNEFVEQALELARNKGLVEYLQELDILHRGACALRSRLLKMELCNDAGLLGRLIDDLFCLHLPEGKYITNEILSSKALYKETIRQHYDSIGYNKEEDHTNLFNFRKEVDPNLADACLNADVALGLILYNRDSLERCLQLSPQDRVASNSDAIFMLLLDYLITDYLETALDLGLQSLQTETKNEPTMKFLQLTYRLNHVCHVLVSHYDKHVYPAVASSFSVQTNCSEHMRSYTERLQQKIDQGLRLTLDSMCNWIAYCLSRQNRGEYDIQDLGVECTTTCRYICQYLEKQVKEVRGGVDGKNCENFVLELAGRIQHVYLTHCKIKLSVSNVGALLLVQDVDSVIATMKKFKVPGVAACFAVLRELCSVLTLQAENVAVGIAKGTLGRLDRETLLEFLECRADWKVSRRLIESKLKNN